MEETTQEGKINAIVTHLKALGTNPPKAQIESCIMRVMQSWPFNCKRHASELVRGVIVMIKADLPLHCGMLFSIFNLLLTQNHFFSLST